jgi:hypothetical protein
LDESKFNEALSQYGFKGPDDLKEAASYREMYEKMSGQYSQAQQQLQQYEAQKELSPYANPLVERIDSFFREGKGEQDVQKFLQIQALDTKSLGYGDAIRHKMRMEYPHLNETEINAQMDAQYGELPAEDDPGYEKAKARMSAKMKIDGQQAKDWIEQQKVPHQDPAAQQKAEQAKQAAERFQASWGKVAQSMVSAEDNLKLSWGANDDKVGGDYKFDYTPKLSKEEGQQVQQMVQQYAVDNNMPLDERSLPALREYQEMVVWNLKRDDFLLHMARDMYASLQERFLQNRAPQPKKGSENSRNAQQQPKPQRAPQDKRAGSFI